LIRIFLGYFGLEPELFPQKFRFLYLAVIRLFGVSPMVNSVSELEAAAWYGLRPNQATL
jgi:hypothetical protein